MSLKRDSMILVSFSLKWKPLSLGKKDDGGRNFSLISLSKFQTFLSSFLCNDDKWRHALVVIFYKNKHHSTLHSLFFLVEIVLKESFIITWIFGTNKIVWSYNNHIRSIVTYYAGLSIPLRRLKSTVRKY